MTKRKPDPLWDMAVGWCDGGGTGPITKSERAKWNKGLKELRDAGATPEQLRTAIGVYKRKNKGMACNPLAIAGQWGRLLADGQPSVAYTTFIDLLGRWQDIPFKERDRLADAVGVTGQYDLTLAIYLPKLRQALALWDKHKGTSSE